MTTYRIATPQRFRKAWPDIRAETLTEATKAALDTVCGPEVTLYRRQLINPGKWRITARRWLPDNTADYETLYLTRIRKTKR